MPRVLVADGIHAEGLKRLQESCQVDELSSSDDLLQKIGDYDALIVRSATKVGADALAAGKSLKVVGRAGVGVDNIDVDAATQHGIAVVNAPTGNIVAAAEHTIAMMFSAARRISEAHRTMLAGEWKRSAFVGTEVSGKTLGMVGLGRVGIEVIHRLQGFEMDVLAYDPFVAEEYARHLGVRLVPLEELLAESDFVSVHTPLTEHTRGLIGDKELARMKPSAYLLNVARGGIVDEDSLLRALNDDQIRGAAIDVFTQEPPTEGAAAELAKHDKVVSTPHLGASTEEAQAEVGREIAEEVLAVLEGRPARHVVNLPLVSADTSAALAPYMQAIRDAAKIGAQLIEGQLQSVSLRYEGSVAQHETDLLKAQALCGLLEVSVSEERVSPVNATLLAEQRGIRVLEERLPSSHTQGDLVTVVLSASGGDVSVSAASINSETHIRRLKGYWLDFVPTTPNLLVTEHLDRPGMIGTVGTVAGKHDMNIAFMDVGRSGPRGSAVMVVGLDDTISEQVLNEFRDIPDLRTARIVRM